jgi:3'-phosphoadenosine 5'-phosphosulfate sulfotransferase (PAPS reductase)/FAD synthetase
MTTLAKDRNEMNLRNYDVILINSSAGKDSQSMLHKVATMAAAQGVSDRVTVVHADLGPRVEWPGTRELLIEQANYYGLPHDIETKRDAQGRRFDILDKVREKGMWPSAAMRWCTSDFKRDQVSKIMTRTVNAWRSRTGEKRAAQVLNCIGIRAEESPKRAKEIELKINARQTTKTTRTVTDWHPILNWSETQVWEQIKSLPVPYHPAYAAGSPRLSCMFCVLAPQAAIALGIKANPQEAWEYVKVERETGHWFTARWSIESVWDKVQAGFKFAEMTTWAD